MPNRIEEQYRALLGTLLENSTEKSDRTGTGTHSVFGRQIRHQMKDGFPLLTTKKMAVKTMMTELKWFLKGDTNIKYLVDNGCNIWNGDAYKNYENNHINPVPLTQKEFIEYIKTDDTFANKWGELGPIYGKQWRSWEVYEEHSNMDGVYHIHYIDQIQNLISDLKTNPDSRRLMVSAWNPGDLPEMALPPCHYGFQVYTRKTTRAEKIVNPGKYRAISLMWIAEEVDMIPDQLIGNLGDVHLYSNHVDQAREQLDREIYDLPTVEFSNVNLLDGEFDYEVYDYKYHPSIKAPLSN